LPVDSGRKSGVTHGPDQGFLDQAGAVTADFPLKGWPSLHIAVGVPDEANEVQGTTARPEAADDYLSDLADFDPFIDGQGLDSLLISREAAHRDPSGRGAGRRTRHFRAPPEIVFAGFFPFQPV
jgi:hypothetical protein